MIATINQTARLRHILGTEQPPTAIAWTLYDPAGTSKGAGDLTPPAPLAVAEGRIGPDHQTAILTVASQIAGSTGDLLRVLDEYGQIYDAILAGSTATTIKAAQLAAEPTEVVSVWCPEVVIEIPAEMLDETGTNWRLEVDVDGALHNIYLSVGRLSLDIHISPREYMDAYPGSVNDLAAIDRPDWPRLVRQAVSLVERKLSADGRIYTAVVSSVSLRAAVAAALQTIVGSGEVPEAWTDIKSQWHDRINNEFRQVMTDVLASASYDKDLSGTVSETDKLPTTSHRRLKW